MYQQELARSGRALFVIRGAYIYLIIIAGTLIAWLGKDLGPFESAGANRAWFWVSLAIAGAGALVRILTSGWAAFGTSGRVKLTAEAAELNTTGPYSLVRNPLYVGRIVNYTGLAMLSGSWAFGALTLLASILIYERISVYEEEFLREKFGEGHARWASEVPALWPRFHGWTKPRHRFWWKRMIWRERQKLFLLGTALFLYWFGRLDFDAAAVPSAQLWIFWAWGALAVAFLITEIGVWTGYYRDMR